MNFKLISACLVLMFLSEQCHLQEVPGLAYMDIMRTAPRKRVDGAEPDPDLPVFNVEPVANRRFDVMLDYDDDYFEYPDSGELEESVRTTLERPENPEAILSTDITDYVLVSVDSAEVDNPSDLAQLDVVSENDFLPVDSFISDTSAEMDPIQNSNVKHKVRKQFYQESAQQTSALRAPLQSEEFLIDEGSIKHQARKHSSQDPFQYESALTVPLQSEEFLVNGGSIVPESSLSSPLRQGRHLRDYAEESYNLGLDYPHESDPGYPYSGDYPSYLPGDYSQKSVKNKNSAKFVYMKENLSAKNTSSHYDDTDYIATSSQLYPTYVPHNYPDNSYDYSDFTREYLRETSSPTTNSDNSDILIPHIESNPTTTHIADNDPASYSTVLSRRSNMPRQKKIVHPQYNKRNRDEILYYTGLQREIEKSSLLTDAIKDVRGREGKMVTFKNRKTITTSAPVPDPQSIRDTLGTHPLYRNLPGMSSVPEVKNRNYIHREYENEKDEYENMYLPARAKSLELSEIDEVKEYFNALVPKTAYKSTDFPRYPSYPGQGIYIPPVTTYKPSRIPKYIRNFRSLSPSSKVKTKPPSALPLEHRSTPEYKPEFTTKLSTSVFRSKPPSPKFYRTQSVFPYTPKPLTSSTSKYYTPTVSYYPKSSSKYYFPTTPSTRRHTEFITYKKKPEPLTFPYNKTTREYSTTTEKQVPPYKPLERFTSSGGNTRHSSGKYYREDNTRQLPKSYHREDNTRQLPKTYYREDNTRQLPSNFKKDDSSHQIPKTFLREDNTRQLSKNFYEEHSRLYRKPITEENIRQKRGPQIERTIDSKVRFPKFGYNIDHHFQDFPSFGYFDYDPSKEIE